MVNKRQIAAAALVLTTALGGFAGSSGAADARAATTVGAITITPKTGLVNLQKVKVKLSRYGRYTGTATVFQCTPKVLTDTTHPKRYCDTRTTSMSHIKVVRGAGAGYFKVRVGRSFKAGSTTSKCSKGGKCILLSVTSGKVPAYVSFGQISFKR